MARQSELSDASSLQIYEYSEDHHGILEWRNTEQTHIVEIMPLSESVKARLYLVEGLTDDVTNIYNTKLGVPLQFFEFHKSDIIRGVNTKVDWDICSFFAKWSRPVWQSDKKWDIESQIANETPYNINTVTDPFKLRLDHERYGRYSSIHRPYGPISDIIEHKLCHAATECISCYWKGFIGTSLAEAFTEEPWTHLLYRSDCFRSPSPAHYRDKKIRYFWYGD